MKTKFIFFLEGVIFYFGFYFPKKVYHIREFFVSRKLRGDTWSSEPYLAPPVAAGLMSWTKLGPTTPVFPCFASFQSKNACHYRSIRLGNYAQSTKPHRWRDVLVIHVRYFPHCDASLSGGQIWLGLCAVGSFMTWNLEKSILSYGKWTIRYIYI